jgi:hypothetical protein
LLLEVLQLLQRLRQFGQRPWWWRRLPSAACFGFLPVFSSASSPTSTFVTPPSSLITAAIANATVLTTTAAAIAIATALPCTWPFRIFTT